MWVTHGYFSCTLTHTCRILNPDPWVWVFSWVQTFVPKGYLAPVPVAGNPQVQCFFTLLQHIPKIMSNASSFFLSKKLAYARYHCNWATYGISSICWLLTQKKKIVASGCNIVRNSIYWFSKYWDTASIVAWREGRGLVRSLLDLIATFVWRFRWHAVISGICWLLTTQKK